MRDRFALRALEKKAWLRTFEHGLWDIGIGTLFLSFGVSILVSFSALAGIWVAGWLPGLREIGRRWVVPRIGTVRFRGPRAHANQRVTLLLGALAILGLAAMGVMAWYTRPEAPVWIQWIVRHFVVVLGLIWGGAVAAGGWLAGVPRFYGYGLLLFASLAASDQFASYPLGVSLTVSGSVIGVTGIFLLVRFLRRYPRQGAQPEGEDNA